jgi:hypothetical protein
MNFLQSSQQIAPYFLGCFRVVIELHTLHARDFVNIEDEAIFDGGEESCNEKGLLIALFASRCSCGGDPKRLKVEES